jgi:hypothetical protein
MDAVSDLVPEIHCGSIFAFDDALSHTLAAALEEDKLT